MKQDIAAGWYPDSTRPNTQRYWDGERWTDNFAPLPPRPPAKSGIGWMGVAGGILGAALVIWLVYEANQPSDLDCATQRAEVALDERSVYELDDACR